MASKRRVRAVVLRKPILDADDQALLLAGRATLVLALLGAVTTLLLWALADLDLRLWWGEHLAQLVAVLVVVRFRSRAAAALLVLLMLASVTAALVLHLPMARLGMAGVGAAVAAWLLWTAVGANAGRDAAARRKPLERPAGAVPALVLVAAGLAWAGLARLPAPPDGSTSTPCPGGICAATDAGPKLSAAELAAAEQRLQAEEPSLPDCYTGEPGQLFVYAGPDGRDVVVERITEVPKSLRKSARCAR